MFTRFTDTQFSRFRYACDENVTLLQSFLLFLHRGQLVDSIVFGMYSRQFPLGIRVPIHTITQYVDFFPAFFLDTFAISGEYTRNVTVIPAQKTGVMFQFAFFITVNVDM
jgi:hypothetical protein